jgi:RNA polymerase sigma-70 factor (ECF subfamily)
VFDSLLIRGVKQKNERALESVIEKYSAYVCTVARNTLRDSVSREDIEEIASDVFLALWNSADKMKNENLKSYLGAISRNISLNKLRKINDTLPLDEDIAETESSLSLEDNVISEAEREAVQVAIFSMSSPDREIFLRYYYDSETAASVAVNMGLTEATVKHRLIRGREKLREIITRGGYGLEEKQRA